MRLLAVLLLAGSPSWALGARSKWIKAYLAGYAPASVGELPAERVAALSDAALAQTKVLTIYDPSYVRIDYPGGDVSRHRGVCSDVVVRAYRKLGVDLQVLVHEDMKKDFKAYPDIYRRDRPDANIDHRRVPNLMTFFSRKGAAVPITRRAADYKPGDIVAWDLGGGTTHIGVIVAGERGEPLVVHNIGWGPKKEDVLFNWTIIGHYRFAP